MAARVRSSAANSRIRADLVLLAMGFLGPRRTGMIEQSGVVLDTRGNVAASV